MRHSRLFSALLVLAFGATAWAQDDGRRAQDGLTPTDILPMGRVTVGLGIETVIGKATLTGFGGALDEKGDLRTYDLQLAVAAGLGFGIEVEAFIPYAFETTLDIDSGGVEFKDTAKGIGDLSMAVNMRLAEESASSPHVMAGLILVFPTGSDDPGEPEVTSPVPAFNTSGEDGGIGDGAFKLGAQLGISKRFENLEPYAMVRYMWGNKSSHGAIETDRSDVINFLVGMEIHAGDQITIDFRAVLDYFTKEVDKDNGTKSTEEAHYQYGVEGRLYGSLGSQVSVVLGVGFRSIQDHAIDKEADLNLEGTYLVTVELGIQIVLGR